MFANRACFEFARFSDSRCTQCCHNRFKCDENATAVSLHESFQNVGYRIQRDRGSFCTPITRKSSHAPFINAAVVSEGLRLASYFGESAGRGTGTGGGAGGGIVPVAGVGAALVLASGSGLGIAATPAPVSGGNPGTGGFAGIGGGFGGGAGFPSLSGGGFTRAAGQSGGGGTGSGTGEGTTDQNQNNTPAINFEATLVNIQTQAQAQFQSQHQSNHGGHGHHGGGHVVPTPASLLLGLLGLPGLYFLSRRKDDAVTEA